MESFVVSRSRWSVLKEQFVWILVCAVMVSWAIRKHQVNDDEFNSQSVMEWLVSIPSLVSMVLMIWIGYRLMLGTISERMIVLRGKGIQLEKKTFCGMVSHCLFIPIENIKYLAINEGFHIDSVIFYLVVVLKNDREKMILPFDTLYPRLDTLKQIFPRAKQVLFNEETQD